LRIWSEVQRLAEALCSTYPPLTSMIRTLLLLIVGCFLFACLAAPPVASALGQLYPDAPWPLPEEKVKLFRKVFNRTLLLAMLGLLIILRKRIRYDWVGRVWRAESTKRRLTGMGVGMLLSAGLGACVFPFIAADPALVASDMRMGRLSLKILIALPAALVVSLLEESFFRVLCLDALRSKIPLVLAALGASAFYSVVHFLEPNRAFLYGEFDLWAGFEYLGLILQRLGQPGTFPGVIGLVLVGLTLCLARLRTRSFGLCVGLHAGWFLLAKMAVYLFDFAEGADLPAGAAGRYYIVGRPATWLSIGVVALAVLLIGKLDGPTKPWHSCCEE